MKLDKEKILILICSIALIVCAVVSIATLNNILYFIQALGGIILILIPYIFARIKGYSIPYYLYLLYDFFIIFALGFGGGLRYYEVFWWWDILLHYTFGVLASFIAVTLLHASGNKKKNWFYFLFIIIFGIGLSGLWEIYEYFCDMFTGLDAQNVALSIEQSGNPLSDTMEDMICGFTGCFVYIILYIVSSLTGKKFNNYIDKQNDKDNFISKKAKKNMAH